MISNKNNVPMKYTLCALAALVIHTTANAQETPETWNLPPIGSSLMVHGGTGLIQTPTSRMLTEG
ncbi:MAG: hypothetical protein ACI9C4_001415, partial [Paraglaciecola sp.]